MKYTSFYFFQFPYKIRNEPKNHWCKKSYMNDCILGKSHVFKIIIHELVFSRWKGSFYFMRAKKLPSVLHAYLESTPLHQSWKKLPSVLHVYLESKQQYHHLIQLQGLSRTEVVFWNQETYSQDKRYQWITSLAQWEEDTSKVTTESMWRTSLLEVAYLLIMHLLIFTLNFNHHCLHMKHSWQKCPASVSARTQELSLEPICLTMGKPLLQLNLQNIYRPSFKFPR